jgi:aminoglycoside phosphotransferase (APT) family kinase protein
VRQIHRTQVYSTSTKLSYAGNAMTPEINQFSLQPRNPDFSLEACLKDIGVSTDTVIPLTGGLVNYVWRVTGKSGKAWILKHAEASLKLNASIESDPARLSYEARGMNSDAVQLACKAVNGVTVPSVISYNDKSHTLVTTDGGTQSLADAYKANELDMRDVGERLAIWLAALHKATQDVSPETWRNDLAESVSMVAANGMPQRMADLGYGQRVGEIARDGYFALQPDEPACCVQGDFRPGNILVDKDDNLSIIDWEDSRRQSPALDLRLFAAQAYLLDVLHGERGLLEAFLVTYRLHAGDLCDERVAYRTAVMFGGFLVFWLPQMDLCNASQSAELAAYGAKVVDRAIAKDRQWLQQSRLAPLFK